MFKHNERVAILYENNLSQVTFDDSMLDTQRGKVFADGLKEGDIVDNRVFKGYAPAQCLGELWGKWGLDDRCPQCHFGQDCWQDTPVSVREETKRVLDKSW